MTNMPKFTDEEIKNLMHLLLWLEDSQDGSDGIEDFCGPHFDNDGKVYAYHVADAYRKLFETI